MRFNQSVDGHTVTKDSLHISYMTTTTPLYGSVTYPTLIQVNQVIQKNAQDFIFVLKSNLPPSKKYVARLEQEGIRAVSGGVLADDYEWQFFTQAAE